MGTARTTRPARTTRLAGPAGRGWRRGPARALAAALLAVTLALAGCSAGGDDSDSGSGDKAARSGAGKEAYAGTEAESGAGAKSDRGDGKPGSPRNKPSSPRKQDWPAKARATHIIRTASLTVRVEDVPKALGRARAAAEDAGGLVGNESTDRDRRGRERSHVVLRVPQDRYEQVLSSLEGTGKLVDRTAKAEDVTEQVVDVESRVKTQRASVARVRELMDRATKISDIVSLEGELSTRQSDLESLLAQQASLKERTALATITLTLTESPGAAGKDGDEDDDPTFAGALSGGWDAFVTML
ncbi:DUF4349 domain-containing protein, partial [Streptomyces sp. NPDC059003]